MNTTSFGRRKAGLLARTTSLSVLITAAIAFIISPPMTTFADGGVGDVKVLGTITFKSQLNQAVDAQTRLPQFAFNVDTNLGQPIPQGAWTVVQWRNLDCNGNPAQPRMLMGFATLNGDNVTYGQGFNMCDRGQNGNITNKVNLATTNEGKVNRAAGAAQFVGSLTNSTIQAGPPLEVLFDLSPKGYSSVNGQLQKTLDSGGVLHDGDWIVVSYNGQTVFAMYTIRNGQPMAMLGDGLNPSTGLKEGTIVKLTPNNGQLPQQSSGGIISWSTQGTGLTGWGIQ